METNVIDKHIIDKLFYNDVGGLKKVNILNVAGGKMNPLVLYEIDKILRNIITKNYKYNKYNLLNLDRMYMNPNQLDEILEIMGRTQDYDTSKIFYYNHEIFDFITRFHYQFDLITMYRFLEHVKKTDVLYFIYLLSTTVRVGGLIDVIVPDYRKLARRILSEDPFDEHFESDDIITTFELLNEPYDPHASIWTKERVHKFFTLEGRFQINEIQDNYYFDGRDIYIRFIAERIK